MIDKPNKSTGLQCDSNRNASRFFILQAAIRGKIPIRR